MTTNGDISTAEPKTQPLIIQRASPTKPLIVVLRIGLRTSRFPSLTTSRTKTCAVVLLNERISRPCSSAKKHLRHQSFPKQLIVGHWPLVTGLLATGHWLLSTYSVPSVSPACLLIIAAKTRNCMLLEANFTAPSPISSIAPTG